LVPQITAGSAESIPVGKISAPEDATNDEPNSKNSALQKQRDKKNRAAARVVGAFDHPLLPMPPVFVMI
jgi:hypothetical protein